jgi:hypothetical protein
VSFQRLFATYHRLYGAKDAVWQAEDNPNHLLKVLADMLNRLVDSSSGGMAALVPIADRRSLIGQCVEAAGIYVMDLFCTVHTTSAGLIAEFGTLQGKLELLTDQDLIVILSPPHPTMKKFVDLFFLCFCVRDAAPSYLKLPSSIFLKSCFSFSTPMRPIQNTHYCVAFEITRKVKIMIPLPTGSSRIIVVAGLDLKNVKCDGNE